jgi:glucose/arabinose dehydrogenase
MHGFLPGSVRARGRGLVLSLAVALTVVGAGCSKAPAAARQPPDTTPPVISGVAVGQLAPTSVTISWTTSEVADAQVEYGTTAAYGQSSPVNSSQTTSHAVGLAGLTASTSYHYRVKSKDAAGNVGVGGDASFTTPAPPDTTPPVIAGVTAAGITPTTATIAWTTDEPADSQVDYGTTASYGQSSTLDSSLTTAHSVALSGLAASTLHHYRVRSRDAAGNLATSGDFTVTTSAQPDRIPPSVAMTAPADGATVAGSVTVSATANDNTGVAGVQFLLDGRSLAPEVTTAPYAVAWDSTQMTNGTHVLSARARDAAGNQAVSASVTVTASNGVQLELAPAVTGFTAPLDLQQPNDGSGRLFVVEQGGKIKIVQPGGQVLASPFIDLSTRPGFTSGGETGLLGLAFHPAFVGNGRFFVNYTRLQGAQLQTVIAEFTASPLGSNTASPATERILFTWDQPFANHNGGGLAFGADGDLYIGLGDGGSGGDPLCNGQNLNTLLGKMLRIDVTTPPPAGQQYVIPADNPFVNQAGRRGEIWLYGLRNPFRFSFDRANYTDLWIGDVGQNLFEEVDLVTSRQGGANLGWNVREGTHPFSSACTAVGTPTEPVFDYSHATGDDSITGGYVYGGAAIPSLAGSYVFGDFVSGRVWTLTKNAQGQWVRSADAVLNMGPSNLSAFGQAVDGELYVVRYSSGEVALIRQVRAP